MNKIRLIMFALLACMLSSCVMGSQNMQNVNERLDQQEKQIRTLNSQLGLGTNSSNVPGQAEMWAQFQGMRLDVNMMRGQLEEITDKGADGGEVAELSDRVEKLEAAIRLLSSQLAIDLPMIEGATGKPAGKASTGTKSTAVQTSPVNKNTDMAKTLYDSGTKAFSDRRYGDAVKIFTDFINTYQKHSLISNAHFWQGESYYQLKNYSNAILSYQQVIEKYPGSNKLQSSMLKQGIAMHNRGQKDAAKVRLNELIRKYPKSPEAARAKQFMEKNP